MPVPSSRALDAVARGDDTARPLAVLQLAALRAAEAPAWHASASRLAPGRRDGHAPALHGQTLPVSRAALRALLDGLATAARRAGIPHGDNWRRVLVGRWGRSPSIDAVALLRASVVADGAELERLARAGDAEPAALAALGHLLTLPLLLACGRRLGAAGGDTPWGHGHCFTCAAWPTLAERRGLERQYWLRCGRCAAAWRWPHDRCAFCTDAGRRASGYLAPEDGLETRRAVVCDACRGYLKAVTTLAPLSPEDLAGRDLTTLELDVAALDRGYRRPDHPAFPLELELVPHA